MVPIYEPLIQLYHPLLIINDEEIDGKNSSYKNTELGGRLRKEKDTSLFTTIRRQ